MTTEKTPDQPRKPGRQKVEPGIRLSTFVPESTFDQIERYAREHDRSLSWVIRQALKRFTAK